MIGGRTTRTVATGAPQTSSWYLVVTAADSSRVVPLPDDAQVVFGRNSDCDVAIDDPEMSRRHAIVRRQREGIFVEDLRSRNGTLLNGAPIAHARLVTAGDVMTIGPLTVIVATSATARGRQLATVDELGERLAVEVERALRYRRPLGLAMLRFDGGGDVAMEHVAAMLEQLRRIDLVAEYSPDEIALILPETALAGTEQVAQRSAGTHGLYGVAAIPEDGASAGELVDVARSRLRTARVRGGGGTSRRAESVHHVELGGSRVVVADPVMKRLFELVDRIAATPISVLISGETGTGKDVVAEALHRRGPRADGPFVRISCAALPEALVESELFGHVAGAFTGADRARRGLFETASGGTLFLDEIGEISPAMQVRLLRVLETRKIVRLGDVREHDIDVRLVCATNRDLEAEVARGRFREDLFYRVSAFVIPVPPLRSRRGEILPMAAQFAHEIATELAQPPVGFTPDALGALAAGDWPGNVRELRNVIERAVVLSAGERIDCRHLPERLVQTRRAPDGTPEIRQKVADVERDMLKAALDAAGGNQTRAAKLLGISRFALARMLARHDLKPR